MPNGSQVKRGEGNRIRHVQRWVEQIIARASTGFVQHAIPSVQDVLGKVAAGMEIDVADAAILEEKLIPELRPAVPVADGKVEAFPDFWRHLGEEPIKSRLESTAAGVGLLFATNMGLSGPCGTAFLVAPELIVTARHLTDFFAKGTGIRNLRFRQDPTGAPARVEFAMGDAGRQVFHRVTTLELIHPFLDIAVLRIEPVTGIAPLALSARDPGTLQGSQVAVIGCPSLDMRYGNELQKSVLGGAPGIKRIMPGNVVSPRLISGRDGRQAIALTHDSITLGGRSGAPVIELATGHVVGVSFASMYLDANFAVPVSEIARDPHFWRHGLKFRNASAPTVDPWDEEWEKADNEPREFAEQIEVSTTPNVLFKAAEAVVDKRFANAVQFRTFLAEHGHSNVLDAVPESADRRELLRALDRRGLVNDRFLQQLGIAQAEPTVAPERHGAWLSGNFLEKVLWAVEPFAAQVTAAITRGSQWRDILLGNDDHASQMSKLVERLAHDGRIEAGRALGWLLQRLYESISTPDKERIDVIKEAMDQVERQTSADETLGEEASVSADITNVPAMQSTTFLQAGVAAARAVVVVQLSETRPSYPTGSTGWLITPHFVVVPAHIFELSPKYDARETQVQARGGRIKLDFNSPKRQGKSVRIASLAWADINLDLAIVELSKPVFDREPLRLRLGPTNSKNSAITMIHHPFLGPQQFSQGGQILRQDEHEVVYLLDTAAGSAGAPVFDERWQVVATHRAYTNYRSREGGELMKAKLGTSTSALLARLRDGNTATKKIWGQILAAQPSLKFVDIRLQREFERLSPRDKLPITIQLGDPDRDPPNVLGFKMHSRTLGLVSGVASRKAIKALAADSNVKAIELSRPVASPECAVSIPHIGAAKVHAVPHAELGGEALIAIIDTGIDVLHECFRDPGGRTRILAFWDQHDPRARPGTAQRAVAESDEGEAAVNHFQLPYGALYLDTDIQKYIGRDRMPKTFPPVAQMTHGTAVSSIAAGRACGVGEERFGGGVSPGAFLVVVRYDLQNASVGYSNGHMDALKFIGRFAGNRPVVVNISNGMNAGAHDGTSALEKVCDEFTGIGHKPGRIIVKSAGNERRQGRHASFQVSHRNLKILRWRSRPRSGPVTSRDPEVFELWFSRCNQYRFCIKGPRGHASPFVDSKHHEWTEYLENGNRISVDLKQYHPDNDDGSLHFEISPGKVGEVEEGEWTLEVIGLEVPKNGAKEALHAWVEYMPDREVFFQDYISDDVTITIPGTCRNVISVGAIEVADYMKSYERSSWGPSRKGDEKPDIVAPGVAIYPAGANRHDLRSERPDSGTSLAAPHVTGAIALALSSCVRRGVTPHTTNRIRHALVDTARHGTSSWDRETGYGELDALAFFENLER